MNGSVLLPPIETLKQQAKRLRAQLAHDGEYIAHGRALELVASQYGYRDWNTLCAKACGTPPVRDAVTVVPGDRVAGRYLGQPFAGEVIGVHMLHTGGLQRIVIEFDKPVDVVKFESFSAFRKRITCMIGPDGRSLSKTSDGVPHMVLDAAPRSLAS